MKFTIQDVVNYATRTAKRKRAATTAPPVKRSGRGGNKEQENNRRIAQVLKGQLKMAGSEEVFQFHRDKRSFNNGI